MSWDRRHPLAATLVDKRLLTGAGTQRPTLHVAFSTPTLEYEPGDLVALFVENEPALVDAVLARLSMSGDEPVTLPANLTLKEFAKNVTVRVALSSHLGLGGLPLRLVRAAAEAVGNDDEAADLEDLCDDADAFDAYVAERDLLDFLEEHPSLSFDAQTLVTLLPTLPPRTYSIASSRVRHPDEVHLTVGLIEWTRNGRVRRGVASAHLSRTSIGETIPLYATASKHFRAEATAPIIFIGPGTGIAPFRGFLQARHGAPLWLFFGARTRAHDFYYADELTAALDDGSLARLDLAFSRDQPDRVYVQERLRERADELWQWMSDGAHVYLCGSAQMAPEVERTLSEIAAAHGQGPGWIEQMKADKRYRRDVY